MPMEEFHGIASNWKLQELQTGTCGMYDFPGTYGGSVSDDGKLVI